MGTVRSAAAEVSQEDVLRANLYRMLAHILKAPPQKSDLELLAGLSRDTTRLGEAIGGLAHLAGAPRLRRCGASTTTCSSGWSGARFCPTAPTTAAASTRNSRWMQLRADMARRGITSRQSCRSPRITSQRCATSWPGSSWAMATSRPRSMSRRPFSCPTSALWAKHFFTDLEAARSSVFYAAVGKVGAVFMDIEEAAFEMV
jgi:hypothetical protein